jgi:Asp-tRNA(Asn)/Glu-tRNA(Gln) amidotransferase C subunit
MSLEILYIMLHKRNYVVVKQLYQYSHLLAEEISARTGLTRKQLYTAIQELKSVDAIRKCKGEYLLTEIANEIVKYLNVIEEIEAHKLDYKVSDIIRADKKLSQEDVQKILQALNIRQISTAGTTGI